MIAPKPNRHFSKYGENALHVELARHKSRDATLRRRGLETPPEMAKRRDEIETYLAASCMWALAAEDLASGYGGSDDF